MAKPAASATLDTGHALYTNLTAAWGLLEGTGATSAEKKASNDLALTSGAWSTDANGDACWSITTANNLPMALTSTITISHSTNFSLAWRAKNNADDNNGGICGDHTDTANFVVQAGGAFLAYRTIDSVDYHFGGASSFTTEANYLLTVEGPSANLCKLYKNGTELNAPGLAVGSNLGGLQITTLGNGYTSTTFGLQGKISYVYLWSGRVLTSTDATTLNSTPYVIFTTGGGGAVPDLRVGYNPAAALA